jgi:solute carrier family 25 citrate transporter 1
MSNKSKGGWRTLAAGGAAGAIDCCFTMPLDTLGTQMQLQGYRTPMECTRAIMKAKGVAGLYAGFWPFLIQSSAKSSIRFFGFEAIQNGVDSMGIDRSKMPGSITLSTRRPLRKDR